MVLSGSTSHDNVPIHRDGQERGPVGRAELSDKCGCIPVLGGWLVDVDDASAYEVAVATDDSQCVFVRGEAVPVLFVLLYLRRRELRPGCASERSQREQQNG